MKKRILSIITCLALGLSLLPAVSLKAGAADAGKTIQLGAPRLEGGQADSIYLGRYQQSSDGDTTKQPGAEGIDWIQSSTANYNGQGHLLLQRPNQIASAVQCRR